MLVDKSDLGFGKRSWRYSMLVRDGVIEKMFIEPREGGRPVRGLRRRHDAALPRPEARRRPSRVVIFAKPGCPHCARAKALLKRMAYEEVSLGKGITFDSCARSPAGTAPQVFIGGKLIGGADDLEAYLNGSQKLAA